MSAQNVEIVRRLYEAFRMRDNTRVGVFPLDLPSVGFEPVYRGHAGVRTFIWQRNRGRASGAVVEYEYAQVWTLRAGLVIRQRTFLRRQDALNVVGPEA